MTLTTIDYGSIASSEIMNNNFSYLDEKINTSNSQINGSISSILSNIATINGRINDLSESITASVTSLQATIADYKNKTKLLVTNSAMVPDWNSCRAITLTTGTSYTAPLNGFILVLPATSSNGSITVNDVSVPFKILDSVYDHGAVLIPIPVKSGDVVSTTTTFSSAYFVATAEITTENF